MKGHRNQTEISNSWELLSLEGQREQSGLADPGFDITWWTPVPKRRKSHYQRYHPRWRERETNSMTSPLLLTPIFPLANQASIKAEGKAPK